MQIKQTWNLDCFYQNEDEFAQAAAALEEALERLRAKTGALSAPDSPDGLDAWCDLLALRDQLARQNYQVHDFVLCRTAQNVNDAEAWQWQGRLSRLAAAYQAEQTRFHEKIRQMPADLWEQLLADPRVRPEAFPLRLLRANLADELPPDQQQVVNDLTPDGYEGWAQLYQRIVGRIRVPFQGEALSLGQAAGRTAHPDRVVRAGLFEATQAALAGEAELCAEALNHMAGFRLALYHRRGLPSATTEALRQFRLSQSALDAMWTAVDAVTPRLIQYLRRKASLLGAEQLHWYDEPAPIAADAAPGPIPYSDAAELVISAFSRFSPGMGALAARAFQEGWIEAENRPGKRPGGFCTVFPLQEESRILLTYGDGPMGPTALAHELGHAYHYHVSQGLPMSVREAPMTLAETASTFAEHLVTQARLAQATTAAQKLSLLDQRLQATVAYLPGMRARYLFELNFHEARRHGPLSVEQINSLMTGAQQQAYHGALASYHPYFWMTKVHYFMTTPFYNFPYTVGYLLSAALFARAAQPGFDQQFMLFLRDTGRDSVEEIIRRHLGADPTRPEFWLAAAEPLLADVDDFLRLT